MLWVMFFSLPVLVLVRFRLLEQGEFRFECLEQVFSRAVLCVVTILYRANSPRVV